MNMHPLKPLCVYENKNKKMKKKNKIKKKRRVIVDLGMSSGFYKSRFLDLTHDKLFFWLSLLTEHVVFSRRHNCWIINMPEMRKHHEKR